MGTNFKDTKANLEQANQVLGDLERVIKEHETLITGTKAAAFHAKESQVLLELAKLPVDRMKDATEETVRIETLRKYGFESVASIYNSSAIQLERIPGITLSAAQALKALADQMYQAVAQSISYGIDIDDLTRADTELIENLQGLDYLRAATKNSTSKMKPIAQTLRNSLSRTQPLNSRFRWYFTGSEKKERALNALQEITYLVGEPTTIALVEAARHGLDALEKRSPQPIEEFKKKSSDYYAILEEVTNVRPNTAANRHFNQELLDKIQAQELDTSTIKATLRQYQTFGGKFALTQNRVIIGDEMGLGFNRTQNKTDLLELVKNQDSPALLASLRRTEVSVGDAILVPAGVAHAIDSGIFVLELQEPTDLSALLEWEGFAVDGIKDGHLGLGFDTVTDALKLDPLTESEFDSLVIRDVFTSKTLRSILPLKADGYFRAHLAPGSGDIEQGFAIALVLSGTGSITFVNAPEMQVTQGDALVIPHVAGGYTVIGAQVIICRTPLAHLAKQAP